MKFDVPAYSQFLDIEDEEWRGKSCGIVSLKMLIDYWNNTTETTPEDIEKLITEALEFDAYLPEKGWKHRELVDVARGMGLEGENFDWTEEHVDIAFNKTVPYLAKHPVMASIYKNLKEGNSGHLVVLTGFEGGKIHYHDPDSKEREDIERSVPLQEFLRGWKKRIILIHPKECECDL